jgi:hypothetical protein
MKHADMALTYAGCVVGGKYPVVGADALDIATELVQCNTAVVAVAGLVQPWDYEH